MTGKSTTFANRASKKTFDGFVDHLSDERLSLSYEKVEIIKLSLSGKTIREIAETVFPTTNENNSFQKINRQIKIFNEDPSVWFKKLNVGWTDAEIFKTIFDAHEAFLKEKRPSKEFNFTYLENKYSALASTVSRKKIPWERVLLGAGLDPTCHIGQFIYGRNPNERQATFKRIVNNLVADLGVENLNDNEMNSDGLIAAPAMASVNANNHCSLNGCQKFMLTKRSIYAQGSRLFGSWEKALTFCGIDYLQDVLRKPGELSALDVIIAFDEWDKEKRSDWVITDLRENLSLEKAIRNSQINKKRKLPFSDKSEDAVFIAWVNLIYFREKGFLAQDEKWWANNQKVLTGEIDSKRIVPFSSHQAQENWSEEKLINGLHRIYARGPAVSRLSRTSINNSNNLEDKTVWSGIRQVRFRKSGKFEDEWLKDAGFIPSKLKKLYKELDKPFTTKEIADKFSALLAESMEFEENRLTREYVSTNDPNFHNFLISHFKSWENALTQFGLDPNFFSLTASKRTKRGYQFQNFFKQLLIKYGYANVVELKNQFQFVYNKSIMNCQHSVQCRPDFRFKNLIIDTKTGYHASQKPEQLKRYKDHSDEVIVLVLKGKSRLEKIENFDVKVLNFHDFISSSHKILGIEIPSFEEQELTKALKRNPFWKL